MLHELHQRLAILLDLKREGLHQQSKSGSMVLRSELLGEIAAEHRAC